MQTPKYSHGENENKILIHGAQAAKFMMLPIRIMSEEAQESCNKTYKQVREHN